MKFALRPHAIVACCIINQRRQPQYIGPLPTTNDLPHAIVRLTLSLEVVHPASSRREHDDIS